jgi:RNA polymerase sigma factor (sigma-70 family)
MMEPVQIPPFERFYEAHRNEVYALLARRLGRARADDAFQETFLRALRAYDRLEHGRHLRAWVLTIAANVAVDELTRQRRSLDGAADRRRRLGRRRSGKGVDAEPPEVVVEDTRPPYEELAPHTDQLPATERAAVVLRYGYDLSYAQIGAALGSSEDAARQAASSGVRRLRRKELQ